MQIFHKMFTIANCTEKEEMTWRWQPVPGYSAGFAPQVEQKQGWVGLDIQVQTPGVRELSEEQSRRKKSTLDFNTKIFLFLLTKYPVWSPSTDRSHFACEASTLPLPCWCQIQHVSQLSVMPAWLILWGCEFDDKISYLDKSHKSVHQWHNGLSWNTTYLGTHKPWIRARL